MFQIRIWYRELLYLVLTILLSILWDWFGGIAVDFSNTGNDISIVEKLLILPYTIANIIQKGDESINWFNALVISAAILFGLFNLIDLVFRKIIKNSLRK